MNPPASPAAGSPDADPDGVLEPLGPPLRRPSPPILGPVPTPARGDDGADDGGRYRRAARPAPPPGESRGVEDPFASSNDVSLTPASTGGSRAIAEPLAALAAAFQANAEALRRSQEMQAELGRALQRGDRSEVMVQTTGALNETFKGLTQVQRSLVSRIDASERSAKEGRWFLPILVLGAMAVLGGALFLVVRRMGELERGVVGTGDTATQLTLQFDKGVEAGRRDAAVAADAERAALLGRIERAAADLKAALAARDERAAAAKQASDDLASAQAEVLAARGEALRSRALEAELTRLRGEAALRDPEVERLKRELADEKVTTAGLRKKLGEVATGRATAAGDPPAADPSAVPDPAAPAADRRDVDRARRMLNELLQGTSPAGGDYVQLAKVGSASAERLTDVMATTYAANGRVLSFIKARSARVVVDRTSRRVELVFDEGSLEMGGQSVPFPDGTFRKVVAEGDAITRWMSSGLLFVQTR
ncbi:MAG: hypothetical protein JNM10_18475 [Planctomycetia bacterium]|nr:hypothetical protein [Planctomycetia bacterium]